MKKIIFLKIIAIVILCQNFTYAQNTNRYYPRFNQILSTQPEDKKLPVDFNYYDKWVNELTNFFYYKNLQTSSSPRNDARFFSFDLIVKKENKFSIANSNIQLVFNDNKDDFSSPITIRADEKIPVNAYFPSFDLNTFNPKNLKQQFELFNSIQNLSQEDIMANIINLFVNEKNGSTKLKSFVSEINQKAKMNIEYTDYNKLTLRNIATQIYSQKNEYSSSILYDIYIKHKKEKEEENKLNQYCRSFTSNYYKEAINDIITYNLNVNLPQKGLSLYFPNTIFEVVDKSSYETQKKEATIDKTFKLEPKSFKITSIISEEKKGMQFVIDYFEKPKEETYFIVPNEIALNEHPYLPKGKRQLRIRKISGIKTITLFLSKSKIEVSMEYEDEKNSEYNLKLVDEKIVFDK